MELSISVQSKNTQNSNSNRSSGMDRVDAAKSIDNRRETVGVETVHSEGVVVSKDVSENDSLDLFASHFVSWYTVELLLFQCRKEALHSCVVEAVSGSAEALTHSTCGNLCTKIVACILTAAVTVENCAVERFSKSFSQPFNSINAKFLLHVVAHFESDDLAVKAVENRRYVQLSVRARYLGNISKQLAERRGGGKVTLYQIFSILRFCICFRQTVRSAALMEQSAFFHGTVYGTPARLDTMLCKCRLNAVYAVIIVVRVLR